MCSPVTSPVIRLTLDSAGSACPLSRNRCPTHQTVRSVTRTGRKGGGGLVARVKEYWKKRERKNKSERERKIERRWEESGDTYTTCSSHSISFSVDLCVTSKQSGLLSHGEFISNLFVHCSHLHLKHLFNITTTVSVDACARNKCTYDSIWKNLTLRIDRASERHNYLGDLAQSFDRT